MSGDVLIGDAIPPRRYSVGQPDIDLWADVSGDRNPLHVDPGYGRATPFESTIAHGHLSLAWLGETLLDWCGPAWTHGGELSAIRFIGPVKPGSTVRVEGEVVEVLRESSSTRCDVRVVDDATGELRVVGQAIVPLPSTKSEGTGT